MESKLFDIPLVNKNELHDTFVYPDESLIRQTETFELPSDFYSLITCSGFPVQRVSSFTFLSSSIILFTTGNYIVLYNIITAKQTFLRGPRSGALCAVATHPEGNCFAVAESHSLGPNIYIYTYPELRLHRVLRQGALVGYSYISFSFDGSLLVSVATEPDYLLSVWDWKQEHANLRAKAFSQDVIRASFSPLSNQILVSSGMGHIKFWKMASTFTGLKLQGTLGKFGATELTDIPCFVFLPSGKVVSGTETGHLLLWEEGFIKYEITNKQGKPCHSGAIHSCFMDGSTLITAGEDGYVRAWDCNLMDGPESSVETNNDVSTNSSEASGSIYVTLTPNLSMDPIDSLVVAKNISIKHLQKIPEATNEYVLMDTKGQLWKLHLKRRSIDALASFHSQTIASLDYSFRHHRLITLGQDGSIRIYDPQKQHALTHLQHSVPGTVLKYFPASMDALGCAFIAAFQDGSVRCFRHAEHDVQDYLLTVRTHAFRPHDQPIIDVTVDWNGSMLVTATKEGQVFFFSIQDAVGKTCPILEPKTRFVPIGLLVLPFSLRSITWVPMVFPEQPQEDELNVSQTDRTRGALLCASCDGKLTLLKFSFIHHYETEFNFLIPASDYSLEPWQLENFSPSISKLVTPIPSSASSHSKKATETSVDSNSTSTPVETDVKTLATETSIEKEVLIKYFHPQLLNETQFIVCIECEPNLTEIRCCSFENKLGSQWLMSIPSKVSAVTLSHSQLLLLLGCEDGTVYVLQLNSTSVPSSHSMDPPTVPYFWCMPVIKGPVTSLACSFDDSMLSIAGPEGAMFTFKSSVFAWKKSEYPSEAPSSPPLEEAADLPHQYTIQEAKRMTQLDLQKEISAKKRAHALEQFEVLRNEFEWIYNKVKELPPELQFPEEELQIDPGLHESIEAETEAKLQRVRNELLWDSEKITIALRKLKRRYYDSIQSDAFSLKGFRNNLTLYSMRTEKLNLQETKETSLQSSLLNAANILNSNERPKRGSKVKDLNLAIVSKAIAAMRSLQDKVSSVSRQEERRRNKLERQEVWKQLMNAKPSPHSDDPQDVAAIHQAQTHMGDYKLKMDKNYVVPENEQVNAEMKKKQILILQSSLSNIMESFNNKVRALQVRRANLEEKLSKVSENTEMERNVVTQRSSSATSGSDSTVKEDKETVLNIRSNLLETQTPKSSPTEPLSINLKSDLKDGETELITEKTLEAEIQSFDRDLESLCHERLDVAIDVKSAEIRLLLLYKEWKLLKEFEKHDRAISEKLAIKLAEKSEIDSKMEEISSKITEQKDLLQSAVDRRKAIESEMEQLIGEGNKHEEILKKIFRKKIKRKKRKETSSRNNNLPNADEEVEEEEEEDESEESDDSDASDEQISDACPPGCDPEVYQRVLDLRELRLDIEDCLADVQKALDIYKKEFELHSKKEKVIASGLKSTEQEIQEFQNQKQRKLNELDTTVPLTLHQIHYFDGEFTDSLVFPQDGLGKLQSKIKETEEQTQEVRKNHQQLKLEHVSLLSNRKEKKMKLKALNEKSEEVQMLKFGRHVDIEKLEKLGINKAADELRQQLLERDKKSQMEVKKMKQKLQVLKTEYTKCIKENTEKLERICHLGESKKKMEGYLDTKQDEVAMDSSGQRKLKDELNEKHIKNIVKMQKVQLGQLQSELIGLIRKPGPIPKSNDPLV